MPTLLEERERLRAELRARLDAANRNARRSRRSHTILLVIALVAGLLATTLAGDSAAGGALAAASVAQTTTGKVPSELPRGWRNVCAVIAVCSFLGTAATGLISVLKLSEQHTRAFVCAGILDGLLADLSVSNPKREALDRARTDLARTLRDYPELFR